jgi:hypothetical protein
MVPPRMSHSLGVILVLWTDLIQYNNIQGLVDRAGALQRPPTNLIADRSTYGRICICRCMPFERNINRSIAPEFSICYDTLLLSKYGFG